MSLAVKPVEVAVLEEVKLNKSKVWVENGDASENVEAIIRHVTSTLYVLEVKKRGAGGSNPPVIKFDFVKIKSYTMKTNTWHELKYEDDKKFALRFTKDDRNFQAFSDQLQVILKIHNKSTKPKYGEDFMKEVKMFRLEMLTPINKSNKGRKVRSTEEDETCRASDTDSGMSAGSGSGSGGSSTLPRPPIGNSSGESFAALQRFGVNKKPQPPIPPQKQPVASRSSNESRARDRNVEDWRLQSELRPDSFDDSQSDRTGSSFDEDAFYSASEHYSDSSTMDLTYDRQPDTSGPPFSSGRHSPDRPPPPVPLRKHEAYLNGSELRKLKPNPPGHHHPPPPPPKSRNDQKQNISLVRTRSDVPPTTTPAGPQGRQNQPAQRQTSLQDPSSSSSSSSSSASVYGTAQSWRCTKCSLSNLALTFRCAACEWTRTDAWECRSCSVVYSVDVVHCQTCPAWRCRLCTFVNSGTKTATTVCEACLQR